MSTHKATYSIPNEILRELNTFVEQRHRSRFVAEAIRAALEVKKRDLENAYKDAVSDKERIDATKAWEHTELEGWNE